MNIFFDTVGCRLNQSEIERMALEFRQAGHTITGDMAEADMVVVNTCAVTSQAASDSRQKLRQAIRQSPDRQIVATGCWATLEPEEVAALSANTRVILNEQKDQLASSILGVVLSDMDLSLFEREALPGSRHRIRGFIKVQDGCDAHCTFCVTRVARGLSRGQRIDRVLADIRSALEGGVKEIVLSGVQLGTWGKHFPVPSSLKELIHTVLNETSVKRLRLSSIEPWDLDREFFRLFKDTRLCRHMHISLQSGSASTLKRMGRQNTPADYLKRLEWAREVDPDFAITTDIIAGFPGETPEELAESVDFIRQAGFSGGHVFPYSARPGTPAIKLPGQVPSRECKIRAAQVRSVLAESTATYTRGLVGRTGSILWEMAVPQADGYRMEGFCGEYIRVSAWSRHARINQVDDVRFTGVEDQFLTGDIINPTN